METKNRSSDLKNKVLKQLYFERGLSIAELSAQTGKSLPLVSKAVAELMEGGIVVEMGYAPSTGGRRPLVYSLHPEGMYILSVAMDQLSTQMLVMDMLNRPVSDVRHIELDLQNNPEALQVLGENIKDFLERAGIEKEKIAGIGIGMPGFVDPQKGVNYTFLGKGKEAIPAYISQLTGLPVYIDNDSSLVALAELKFGAAKSRENAMIVNVGWGVGLGMIVNGQLFRGHSGFAGEFSHIPISESGALCRCGKRGCLETECSLLVVAARAKEEMGKGSVSSIRLPEDGELKKAAEAVMDAAVQGDQYAVELFSDAGYVIGRGLAILIHIMNPEVIILSGRGARVGNILLASAQQALHKYAIPRLAGATELTVSRLNYQAELIGAAALVVDNLDNISLYKESLLKPN